MRLEEQNVWNDVIHSHWWGVGHYRIVCDLISRHMSKAGDKRINCLDVGCSNGHISDFLRRFGYTSGFDMSFESLSLNGKKGSNVQADARAIPYKDGKFDLVTMLDVVEHVDDDKAVLNEIHRVCRKDAALVISVPALSCLWGEHDIWNGHKRRYSRTDIKNIARASGFEIERATYMHPHLFPPLYVKRILGRLRGYDIKNPRHDFVSFNPAVDRVLLGSLSLERRALNYLNFPIGTSLFAILRRR